MKKILTIIILILGVTVTLAYVTIQRAYVPTHQTDSERLFVTQTHDDFGFSYEYRDGVDGYIVLPSKNQPLGDTVLSESVIRTRDYEDSFAYDSPHEAPVSLTIEVFRNPMNLSAEEWAQTTAFQKFTLTDLNFGTDGEVMFGTTWFSIYRTDGLYSAEVYVHARHGYIYVFTNSWIDEQSQMKVDMENVIASIVWSTPKLLSYVTHPDISVTSPRPYTTITSPLSVTGKARGSWFFEASFPVTLVNWDGLILGEGVAIAQGDWMTEDLVPFTASITFTKPLYGEKGALILKKDNPSGLPEYDDMLEIPIVFR